MFKTKTGGKNPKSCKYTNEDMEKPVGVLVRSPPFHQARYDDLVIQEIIKNMTYNEKLEVLGLTHLPHCMVMNTTT